MQLLPFNWNVMPRHPRNVPISIRVCGLCRGSRSEAFRPFLILLLFSHTRAPHRESWFRLSSNHSDSCSERPPHNNSIPIEHAARRLYIVAIGNGCCHKDRSWRVVPRQRVMAAKVRGTMSTSTLIAHAHGPMRSPGIHREDAFEFMKWPRDSHCAEDSGEAAGDTKSVTVPTLTSSPSSKHTRNTLCAPS